MSLNNCLSKKVHISISVIHCFFVLGNATANLVCYFDSRISNWKIIYSRLQKLRHYVYKDCIFYSDALFFLQKFNSSII